MGACCLSGAVHEGSPQGREDTIGGLPTYIAEPSDKSTAKTVVFIVDIFGWKFKNVRLLADQYAKAGFYCYIPDVHEGDSLPIEFLQSVEPPLKKKEQEGIIDKAKETVDVMATLGPWLAKHREAVAEPLISGFINTVRTIPGTNKIGGEYSFNLSHGLKIEDTSPMDCMVLTSFSVFSHRLLLGRPLQHSPSPRPERRPNWRCRRRLRVPPIPSLDPG
jgi:hypothetical protein